jgi:hypothetical protein
MHIYANPAEANGGAAKVDCSAKNTSADSARQNWNQAAIIRAELVGSDTCTVEGHTARGAAPILSLCRKLIEAGVDPDRPLHAYRSDVLTLIVHTLGAGARLTVAEGDRKPPHLRQWKAWRSVEGSPPVDFNASDHAGGWIGSLRVPT